MLPTFLSQWKMLFVSLAALTASITSTTSAVTQSFNPNAANIPAAAGTSRNWAGYASTNGSYTSISGTWTIPQATGSSHTAIDATWVGIGGVKTTDLIQSGTQNVVNPAGQVSTSAFYELLPDVSQTIPVTINSGDSVTVSISQQSSNTWGISFKDNTNGNSYQKTLPYISSLSSAEWIEEAPSNGRSILPLDNFGTISITNGSTSQNGSHATITQSNAQAITMANGRGQALATPSAIGSDGASFTISRTAALSNNAVPQYDRNPSGWRRRGLGIGQYSPIPSTQWSSSGSNPTPSVQQVIPQPTGSVSSPAGSFRRKRFYIRRFLQRSF